MNRSQKLAALAKVLQASDSETAVKQLEAVRANQPKPRIIIDDFGLSDEVVISDSTLVWFLYEGSRKQMPLGEVRGWLHEHVVPSWVVVLHPEI